MDHAVVAVVAIAVVGTLGIVALIRKDRIRVDVPTRNGDLKVEVDESEGRR